jgi:hypothetical protein
MQTTILTSDSLEVKLMKVNLPALEADLLNTPAPDHPLTNRQALVHLVPTFKKMIAAGHTRSTITLALASKGIHSNARAVALVLREHRSKRDSTHPKK